MRPICLLAFLLIAGHFGKAQSTEPNTTWYKFYWDSSDLSPREAILLKSTIDTLPFNFRWQFDTGSPQTFFYGKLWNSFLTAYPHLKNKFSVVDSSRLDGYTIVKNNRVKIGENGLIGRRLGVLENYGNAVDSAVLIESRGASATIGTIGIDLFRQGVLILDFPNLSIGYAESLSEEYLQEIQRKGAAVSDFMLYRNRIIIPVSLGGKTYKFLYDSGASLFAVKTTAKLSKLIPPVVITDTLKNITTWGKSHDVPGGIFKQPIKIGQKTYTGKKVYIHPDPDLFHTKILEEAEVVGLIGNEFFYDKKIIFDFTRMKFIMF